MRNRRLPRTLPHNRHRLLQPLRNRLPLDSLVPPWHLPNRLPLDSSVPLQHLRNKLPLL
jgi:hypothetical protein